MNVCGSCRGEVGFAVGEELRGGENHWFLERLCGACHSSWVEVGRGFVPDPLRERFSALTGRWRVRVCEGPDQGSDGGGGVAVLRFLRRVYGCSIGEARVRRGELAANGLAGTCGEVAWLAYELGEVGVAASVTLEVAGTQTELPERRMPSAPSRVDGGPAGSPVVVEDEAERLRIAGYLQRAQCLVAGGYWLDPVTRDPRHRGGEAVMSDGTYVWSIAWATLLPLHGLPLAGDFVAHVRRLGYEPPAFTEDELTALLVATGLEPPEEF